MRVHTHYTKNAALEGILTHCVVWCLAAFYGLSLFNFHWIGSAWRFLPPLYSLHSKEVEKSFEFWCPKKNCLEVFQNRYLLITKNLKKKSKGKEKILTLKTAPESKPEFDLTKTNLNQLIKRHLGKVELFWEGHKNWRNTKREISSNCGLLRIYEL